MHTRNNNNFFESKILIKALSNPFIFINKKNLFIN